MFVVDTNILLYATDQDSPVHDLCRSRLEEWRHQTSPWYLTWGIVYEFLRVATHPNVFRKPLGIVQGWSVVEAVLASPSVSILCATDRHAAVAREVFEEMPDIAGNLVFDAHTAVLMREHGIRAIYTRDADFHRFPFIDVLDPIHPPSGSAAPRRRPKGRAGAKGG